MYTTLIQYQHNIVRHRRYFFDVNIVDFATSTVFNRYRVYTVDFADISLTFTSSTWQCIRCWTHCNIGYIAERVRCRHDVEQHCDVDDINMKEDARYRFDVGQYCYFDDVVYETGLKKIRYRPDVDERCDVDDVNKTEDPQCRQNVHSMLVNIAVSTILIAHCVLDIPHKLHTFDRCYCNCYLGKLQVIWNPSPCYHYECTCNFWDSSEEFRGKTQRHK